MAFQFLEFLENGPHPLSRQAQLLARANYVVKSSRRRNDRLIGRAERERERSEALVRESDRVERI